MTGCVIPSEAQTEDDFERVIPIEAQKRENDYDVIPSEARSAKSRDLYRRTHELTTQPLT